MGFSKFEHVKISAIAGVVPEKVINIDDEIEFYNNNPKLLERNKKILGLGTRHVLLMIRQPQQIWLMMLH